MQYLFAWLAVFRDIPLLDIVRQGIASNRRGTYLAVSVGVFAAVAVARGLRDKTKYYFGGRYAQK